MKITVDVRKCIGAGNCVEKAPGVFAQGEDDGIVILLQSDVDATTRDAAIEAAQLCPTQAIVVDYD